METFSVSINDAVLQARILGRWDQLHANLLTTIRRLAIRVQGYVKESKLTGQVLHVRTGTLRRSINQTVDDLGTEIWAKVGTNVKYARVHEYGFTGAVDVRSHVRRLPLTESMMAEAHRAGLKKDGTPRKNSEAAVLRAIARMEKTGAAGYTTVRAHSRMMNMPERSFLRSSLSDLSDEIRTSITRTVRASL
jgi:phage gpG-like protein